MKPNTVIHGKQHCWIGVTLLAVVLGVTAYVYQRSGAEPGKRQSPVHEAVREIRKSVVESRMSRTATPPRDGTSCCTSQDSWARYAMLK